MRPKRRMAALVVIVTVVGGFVAGATATITGAHVGKSSHTLTRSVSIDSATTLDLPLERTTTCNDAPLPGRSEVPICKLQIAIGKGPGGGIRTGYRHCRPSGQLPYLGVSRSCCDVSHVDSEKCP